MGTVPARDAKNWTDTDRTCKFPYPQSYCRPSCARPRQYGEAHSSLMIESGHRLWLPGGQRYDVRRRQWLSPNAPVAALDLFDHDPGHAARVLALDLDHRVGQL